MLSAKLYFLEIGQLQQKLRPFKYDAENVEFKFSRLRRHLKSNLISSDTPVLRASTKINFGLSDFHDHRSNNNREGGGGGSCPPPMTDGSKKAHVK